MRVPSSSPFLCLLLPLLLYAGAAGAQPQTLSPTQVVAHAGNETITVGQYALQLQQGVRQRFYHGKVPQPELEKFAREMLQQMIERSLLLQEAKRQRVEPDKGAVEEEIARYEKQYAQSEQWQRERGQRLPLLRNHLAQKSQLERVEQKVRKSPSVSERQIRDYYAQHPDKFTTPEKIRVSLILLKVDPSAPAQAWQGAQQEGAVVVEKLRKGGDFAALAKLHSGDASAAKGGDLGYLHKGMLPEEAQQRLDKLKPGEVAEPMRLLQGIAVMRLDERQAAQLNSYEQVKERATQLLQRDLTDAAWQSFKERLYKQGRVSIDEGLLKAIVAPDTSTAATTQR